MRDLKYSWRRLWRNPGFAILAVFTLTLSIGASTSIFTVLEAVVLRPLPYRDPGRLVAIWEDHSRRGGNPRLSVAPATYADYRRQSRAFQDMAAKLSHAFDMVGEGRPERLYGSEVSPDFFLLLGARAGLGRTFGAGDFRPGAELTVVLSDDLWQRRFAGQRQVLGRVIVLDDQAFTVIGVMPPGFAMPLHLRSPQQNAELWVPLRPRPQYENHGMHIYEVLGRLAPGSSLAAARTEMSGLASRLATELPRECAGVGATLVPLGEQIVGEARASLLALFGATTFLLLIACANLASLLLARGLARMREMAVCAALGARPAQLVRQLLAEGAIVAALGGAGGTLLAAAALAVLPGVLPADLPRAEGLRLDGAVLAYAWATALVTGLLAALVPALRLTREGMRGGLAEGGRGSVGGAESGRLAGGLVVAQMALSLLLLAGAGLMIESFSRLRHIDPGFRTSGVLVLDLAAYGGRYARGEQQVAFFREVIRRLQALPGVSAVGGISRLPLEPAWGVGELFVEGKPVPAAGAPQIGVRSVTPDYFIAMTIPVVAGRPFSERDDARRPAVALVNRALARRYFAGEKVLGRRLKTSVEEPWAQVVGVVGDVAHDGLAAAPLPEVYVPDAQAPGGALSLALRTRGDPLALAPAARRQVWAVDRDLPIGRVRTLERQVEASIARPRFSLLLVAGFAGLALALAALGIFGLMAYSVAQRTREIGIRMALGARRGDVQRRVLIRTARLAAAGIGIGMAGAVALARWLAGQLYQVRGVEPVPLAGAAVFLLGVALLAGYLPARRAARVDPTIALRHE